MKKIILIFALFLASPSFAQDDLMAALDLADDALETLETANRILARNDLESLPTILPVKGPITSGFGTRIHPILRKKRFHNGIDIGAATGTPVMAAGGGRVIYAGAGRGYQGYGYLVVIEHSRDLRTYYAHLSVVGVYVGELVKRGEKIGLVGSTGLSVAPHLHYEVRDHGVPVDPRGHIL